MAWTRAAADSLAPGGRLFVVIGDGHDRAGRIDTLQTSIDAMTHAGLTLTAWASADRRDMGRGLVLAEHAIVADKPGS